MFCDICEFDKVIAEETTNIVKLLDTFFKTCDMLCLQHGVQKIEVIRTFWKDKIYINV